MAEPDHIFDRIVYLRRQHIATGEAARHIDRHMAQELQDRLAVINHQFSDACLIAVRPDPVLEVMRGTGKFLNIKVLPPGIETDLKLEPASLDCLVSLLDLQTIDDVPGYLAQVSKALRPDGLALFAFFAGDTLPELRQCWLAAESELTGGVTPRVAPMIDLRQAGSLLQRAGLALPVADMDRVTLRYADALSLMREIKASGFANPLADRSRRFTSRRLLARVSEIYLRNHAGADGRVAATIEIAWALAWKPHPSQQQPLKPGSAKASLAAALRPK